MAKFLLQIPLLGTRLAANQFANPRSRSKHTLLNQLSTQTSSNDNAQRDLPHDLFQDLTSLIQLTSNALDSFSTMLLLPERVAANLKGSESTGDNLTMITHHSLSEQLESNCTIKPSYGLIGWVARNRELLHVSPFEGSSTTLGTYRKDVSLKSLAACPVYLERDQYRVEEQVGVLVCDSKKSYAFSKVQLKLLQEFALQFSRTLRPHLGKDAHFSQRFCWDDFCDRAESLWQYNHPSNLSFVRMRVENRALAPYLSENPDRSLTSIDQLYQMILMSLSDKTAALFLPNGEMCFVLSNSNATKFTNKINRILEEQVPRGTNHCYRLEKYPLVADNFSGNGLLAALKVQLQCLDCKSEQG